LPLKQTISLEKENTERLISQLKQLKNIDRMYRFNDKNFTMSNLSYENVDLSLYEPNKTIIYCDIPYKNTSQTGYTNEQFNYENFYNHCKEWHKQGFRVFVSEYSMPSDDFVCVFEVVKNSKLSSKKDSKADYRVEKLFEVKDDIC